MFTSLKEKKNMNFPESFYIIKKIFFLQKKFNVYSGKKFYKVSLRENLIANSFKCFMLSKHNKICITSFWFEYEDV